MRIHWFIYMPEGRKNTTVDHIWPGGTQLTIQTVDHIWPGANTADHIWQGVKY
jgi:hypothetical protein